MNIVIDTNRIIAALIKDGLSRKILFDGRFEFIAPDYILTEIVNNKEEIKEKINIASDKEFDDLLAVIFKHIEIISREQYQDHLGKAKAMISDLDDVPFIALALAYRTDAIWSDDPHFLEQKQIRILKTRDFLEFSAEPDNS